MSKLNKDGSITILTVYTPTEALYYFADEWEKDPNTAEVIKRIKYKKPPVVRLGSLNEQEGKYERQD